MDLDVDPPVVVVHVHVHAQHVDAWLPAAQGFLYIVDDHTGGAGIDRREQQLVDAATELGPHHPLAGRGTQDDPNRLVDLLLAARQGDPAAGVHAQREGQAVADERI